MGRRAKTAPSASPQPSPTSPRKRALLAGAVLVLAGAVLGGGTALVIGAAERNAPVASVIAGTAPADADTFVVAPASPSWWSKVADMAPVSMKLTHLDLQSTGAPIARIGYSRSPDHVHREIPKTGPLRYVYLETATAADADKVATWLKQTDGFDNRRVYENGQVVIIASGWVTTYTPPAKAMSSVAAYRPTARSTEATMWINEDQQVPSITVGEDNAKAMTAMLHNGYGFKDGTTWIGNSGDGNTWKGSFTNGGVDKSRINFNQANSSLRATEKILAGSPSPSPRPAATSSVNTGYQLIDPGASAVLSSSAFAATGQPILGQSRNGTPPLQLGDSLVTSTVDVTGWNAAFSGVYSGQEDVLTQTVSANDTDMSITFTYAKN